jgi:hypothetical protein
MDANKHFQRYLDATGNTNLANIDANEIVKIALKFAIWPSVSTYENSPWLAPFAIRRARIRTEVNAPGHKRDLWGLPTELGYFADDNSLIKSFPLKRTLTPATNPYGHDRITKGLVCCHIWPATTTSPLLFSFVPNLVWLPKSLANFSDAHLAGEPHPVHYALRKASLDRYGTSHPNERVAQAWELLEFKENIQLGQYECTEIADDGKISLLAKQRTLRMIDFLELTLIEGVNPPNRFSKRYHAGAGPRIDKSVMSAQEWLPQEVRERLISEMKECL